MAHSLCTLHVRPIIEQTSGRLHCQSWRKFCMEQNKRREQQSTLAVAPFGYGGIRAWLWGLSVQRTAALHRHLRDLPHAKWQLSSILKIYKKDSTKPMTNINYLGKFGHSVWRWITIFINRNIDVLSGRFAIVGRSQQNIHYLGGAFVGHIARPLRQRLYIFYARVLIVYEHSSSGQAIFYKSIARVKGDVSVNWVFIGINSLHE